MPIIELDSLVPDDIEIKFKGETYTIPGDLDTPTILSVFKHFQRILNESDTDDDTVTDAVIEKAYTDMNALLLEVFQIRRPDLKVLPFGQKSLPIVVATLLNSITEGEADEETDPTPAPANRSPRKKPPSSGRKPAAKR